MNYYSDSKKAYDDVCKRILSEKSVLAWIMKTCIREYKDVSIEDIKTKYIEPEILVGTDYLDADAELYSPTISGLNTEDISLDDGMIRYDIKFKALLPNTNEMAELIINIEANGYNKKDSPILKRAMYYASRLISSQKGVEFKGSKYEGIKKVYSIWVITNLGVREKSSINNYRILEENVLGDYNVSINNYDLLDIIMIRLGNDYNDTKIMKLLNLLLRDDRVLSTVERKELLKEEYDIDMSQKLYEEVEDMCNLSDVVENRGYERGILQGIEQGIEQGITVGLAEGASKEKVVIALNMINAGSEISFISNMTGLSESEIKELSK